MKRRRLVLLICGVAVAAMFVRIRYVRLDWGAYWSVDIVAPWHR